MTLKRLLYLFSLGLLMQCNTSHPSDALRISELGVWVDQSEVTALQFDEFRNYYDMSIASDSISGFVFDTEGRQWAERGGVTHLRPNGEVMADSLAPATQVSWSDACAYCNALNGRLPTSEEWEFIASGEFLPGNIWEGYFPLKDEGMDGFECRTAPVKSFKPNAKNLFDLHGNVWEWTSSKDTDEAYFIKGGSFLTDYNQGGFLPGYRKSVQSTTLRVDLGFRCVYEH